MKTVGKRCYVLRMRQGEEMLYGPTNEELITDIFRSRVIVLSIPPTNSYITYSGSSEP